MHPRPSPVERATLLCWWAASVGLARLIGKVLPLFPTAAEQFGGKLPRLAAGGGLTGVTRRRIVDPADRHQFALVGGAIMCQRCLSRSRSWARAHDRTIHQPCPGQCQALVEAWRADSRGHSLQLLSQGGSATVICVRCGAFASAHRSAILADPCRGESEISEQRRGGLRRHAKGKHPDYRRPGWLDAAWSLRGGELFEFVSVFCSICARFVRIPCVLQGSR